MSIADKLTTIAGNQHRIYQAGYDKGVSEGGGSAEDYEKGVEDGKKAEYDAFWDAYQENGNRKNYRYAFYRSCWNDTNFKPKYDIVPSADGQYIFQNCAVTDMKSILERQGVTIDFSKTTSLYYCFSGASVTHLPELNCVACANLQNAFNSCSNLVSIDKITISEKATGAYLYNMFGSCDSLEHIIFDGVIAANSLDVHWSTKLTHDSLMSIINTLADKSTDTSGTAWGVTLGTENLAKLTDAEKAIATGNGWTLA